MLLSYLFSVAGLICFHFVSQQQSQALLMLLMPFMKSHSKCALPSLITQIELTGIFRRLNIWAHTLLTLQLTIAVTNCTALLHGVSCTA